jgi:hypothetical protein
MCIVAFLAHGRFRRYSSQGQAVRFAYVTSLRVGEKQTRILRKPKTLPTYEMRQLRRTAAGKWSWYGQCKLPYLLPPPLPPLILLPITPNGCGTRRLALTTVISATYGFLFFLGLCSVTWVFMLLKLLYAEKIRLLSNVFHKLLSVLDFN